MKVLKWAMKTKGVPEVLARSVMRLHERRKTRVQVDAEESAGFEVNMVMCY